MDSLYRYTLIKQIQSEEFSEARLLELSEVFRPLSVSDALPICRAMSQAWGAGVLPVARALLNSKKAAERDKALSLFSHVPDLRLVLELEEAKAKERSKKLIERYDLAIYSVQQTVEILHPPADPRDVTADPVVRGCVLRNMPSEQFAELIGHPAKGWSQLSLPYHGDDPEGKRPARIERLLRSGELQPYWLVHLEFIAHPLAGASATELVWEAHVDSQWSTFRGTLAATAIDVAGRELSIPADAPVRLAHPIELPPEVLLAWRELAASEDWTANQGQLARTSDPADETTLVERVDTAPALGGRKLCTILKSAGLKPTWEHEHRLPHTVEHRLYDDRDQNWLLVEHDGVQARRSGARPVRLRAVTVLRPSPRRFHEALRLIEWLVDEAGMNSPRS